MEEAKGTEGVPQAAEVRVDWRTGREMVQHDDAFWREHEQRRLEQSLSVPRYCAANGLALSTYRHRVFGKHRTSANTAASASSAGRKLPNKPAFVAVAAPRIADQEALEVVLEGMTLRLRGDAAERVLAGVMGRLA